MVSHVSKMTLLLYIALLMSVTLACGAMSQLPAQPTATNPPVSAVAESTAESESYTVTGSWHVRECAGEDCEIVGVIENVVVVCYQYQTVDGGRWCRHDAGWSNMRGMK